MKMNIEEMLPDAFKEIRVKEDANRPDPGWFFRMQQDKLNACMSKYIFASFDDIPEDNCSGSQSKTVGLTITANGLAFIAAGSQSRFQGSR